MPQSQTNPSPKKCYIYLLDTIADWEIAYITAELNSRRYFTKNTELEFGTIGNTKAPIKTMGGITIIPDKDLNDIDFQEGDTLILPGADTWMDEKNKKIIEITSQLISKNVTIAAICGATAALAQSGLLNNKKHTSNAIEYLKMVCPNYKGSSNYQNTPTAVDNNLITATGLAPLEFAYEVFKKLNVMNQETVESWYQLNKTQEPKYFFSLKESLK